MPWYAIHTKPRQELTAQSSLGREGIETFFPRLRRKRLIRRKHRWGLSALFPNYLFARFDLGDSGRRVRYAQGVSSIVSFGGKPAVVDDSVVLTIRARCEQDILTLPPPALTPGDRVQIQEGPLMGLRGIFERELSGSERVVILLEAIGLGARVEVSRSQVEKL